MTTKELLEIVERRGLKVLLRDGEPFLHRPKGNKGVTDRLLSVLKRHREPIVSLLSKQGSLFTEEKGAYG